jgi:hypothetical protein
MAASNDREVVSAVIAAAGSLSAAVPLGGKSVLGVMPPATGSGDFNATTVYLLFSVSMDGVTYSLLKDVDEAVVYVTVAANNTNGATYIDPTKTAAWTFIKVACYATDKTTAVAQTAETTIPLCIGKVTG